MTDVLYLLFILRVEHFIQQVNCIFINETIQIALRKYLLQV